jgi:hypothetical protein
MYNDEVALIDISEEESQKEIETSIDEDVIIKEPLSKISIFSLEENNDVFKVYRDDSSIHASSVHLPPPEFNA